MTRLEELLSIIPGSIDNPILKTEWENNEPVCRWSDYNCPYNLRIEKRDNKFEAFYVFTGFEGETQILPFTDYELQQRLEYGGVIDPEDRLKDTLEEALEDLLCWLRKTKRL